MKKFVSALIGASAILLSSDASAQWQVPTDATPVGRGAGVTGFGYAQAACYVGPGAYATINAALAACTSNATIVVTTNQTVTAPNTINGSGVTLTCLPGVVITMNPQTRFSINGTHFTADGCQYQGVGQTTLNNFDLFLITADYATIKNNTISNWGANGPTPGGSGIVRWIGGNHGRVLNNNFFSNGDFDLSISPCCGPPTSITDFLVEGNTITNPLILGNDFDHPIIDLRFVNNRTKAEHVNGVSLICVFLVNLRNPVISDNSCQQQTNIIAGVGGIWSIGQGQGFVVSNNVHDTNGFTYEDYSFELGQINGGFISNNYAKGIATNGLGFVCNSCQNLTYTGNVQDGWKSGASPVLLIPGHQFIEAGSPSPVTQSSLTITGNIAIASPTATNIIGIEINSLVVETQVDFTITGNVLVGPTTPTNTHGIFINAGAGTISGIQIGPNALQSWGVGVNLVGGVSNVCLAPGWINATTPIVDSSVGGINCTGGKQTITRNVAALPAFAGGLVGLHIGAADGATTGILLDGFGSSSFGTYNGRRSGGTAAAPSALGAGITMFRMAGFGYGATGYSAAGRGLVEVQSAEAWSDTAQGTNITISTTPTTTTTTTRALRIEASGGITIGAATADQGVGTIAASSYITTGVTTVGALPVCNAGRRGARYMVTDNTGALTFGGAVVGAGGTVAPVFCNGTAWLQG